MIRTRYWYGLGLGTMMRERVGGLTRSLLGSVGEGQIFISMGYQIPST